MELPPELDPVRFAQDGLLLYIELNGGRRIIVLGAIEDQVGPSSQRGTCEANWNTILGILWI
jgi:hypothetical protein